jgi:hypothetical protein
LEPWVGIESAARAFNELDGYKNSRFVIDRCVDRVESKAPLLCWVTWDTLKEDSPNQGVIREGTRGSPNVGAEQDLGFGQRGGPPF